LAVPNRPRGGWGASMGGGRIISQGTLSIYKSKYEANNTSKIKKFPQV